MTLRLESTYVPAAGGPGTMRLRLVNAGRSTLADFRLAFTTVVPLTPADDSGTRLAARTSGYHELTPSDGVVVAPGGVWDSGSLVCGHRPGHANDGPASAFVILADGSARPVSTGATGRAAAALVGRSAPPAAHLADPDDVVAAAWSAATRTERALHPADAAVLTSDTAGSAVTAAVVPDVGQDSFHIDDGPAGVTIAAGSAIALQWAFMELARRRRDPDGDHGAATHRPRFEWRGLHIDLARRFLPSADVEWLIEVAAWRRINRLHLHLTDDEAWRVPIAAYPALTDVGAWRGHGLPIPPLLGSGAEPYGGSYTAADIRRWVARATTLGIELIPEVDLPAHCFAAIAAVPALVDPEDTSAAVSVQHFVDNVLNPGVAATRPFLEAVFGELADLFPSPWLHLGGDEVPAGAWRASPAAQRYATARALTGTGAIGAAFVADVVDVIRTTTGRQVGAWQEAADCGALRPGDGYVVAWKSNADTRRLAAAGHAVVAAPAEAYYLDMAADPSWSSPGASWAGSTSMSDVERFDVTSGWTEGERSNLLGIQACLWTEHVADRPAMERVLFPRLDAIAASAWRAG